MFIRLTLKTCPIKYSIDPSAYLLQKGLVEYSLLMTWFESKNLALSYS
jgi:hypothetical protein